MRMIAERLLCDRCHQSLSVFGQISRRVESDRAAIAVINRLAFLAKFRGEMAVITSVFGRSSRRDWSDRAAIAVIDRRWFSAGFLVAITVRTKKT